MITALGGPSPCSIRLILSAPNLAPFFFLPFTPAGRRNPFFSGHIATARANPLQAGCAPRSLAAEAGR